MLCHTDEIPLTKQQHFPGDMALHASSNVSNRCFSIGDSGIEYVSLCCASHVQR